MICGKFTVARPSRGSVLELLPPVLLLKPTEDGEWLEAILRRMVSESAHERPGQGVALSRLTEVLFVEVLRNWIKSLAPGEGGWLGAMADPHIGPALQLIHERPDRPWTLDDLGQRVGLGRSAFSARFTKLVGQSMYRYLIGRRMSEAAFLLESSDEAIARIATRVGYETVAAFSKVFHRHHGLTPGRYRAARRSDGGRRASGRSGSRSRRLISTQPKYAVSSLSPVWVHTLKLKSTDHDGIFCDDPIASISSETSNIDQSVSIVAETEFIPDRRISLLNSRSKISDGPGRRFLIFRAKNFLS